MKSILKNMGISALLIFMFSLAKAQDTKMPSAEARAAKMSDWMKTNLNLTTDQLTRVQDLNMKYAVKMDSLRNSSLAKEDKFASMKSDGAARDSELKGVLTEDQYKIYQDKKQEMKGRYKEKAKEKSQGADQ